jgi:hypothetical protein
MPTRFSTIDQMGRASRVTKLTLLGVCAAACGGRIAIVPSEEMRCGGDVATPEDDATTSAPAVVRDDAASGRTIDVRADASIEPSDEAVEGAPELDAAGDAPDGALWCGDVRAVTDCVAYQLLLKSCLQTDIDFACQASLVPTADADVASVEAICADNLMRLQTACRSPARRRARVRGALPRRAQPPGPGQRVAHRR